MYIYSDTLAESQANECYNTNIIINIYNLSNSHTCNLESIFWKKYIIPFWKPLFDQFISCVYTQNYYNVKTIKNIYFLLQKELYTSTLFILYK